MNQQDTIQNKENSYLVNFKVIACIEGECILENSKPMQEEVLQIVHEQLRLGGLIDFTENKCEIIDIDTIDITPVKQCNGIFIKIGEMFNVHNIVSIVNQRIFKNEAAKCST